MTCLRCNTPRKCALYGCSPLTWPAERPAVEVGPDWSAATSVLLQAINASGGPAASMRSLADKVRRCTESMRGLAREWHRAAGRQHRGKRARRAAFAARQRAKRQVNTK